MVEAGKVGVRTWVGVEAALKTLKTQKLRPTGTYLER